MSAEGNVRKALEDEFGQPFQPRTLRVGSRLSDEPAYKQFDAVSQDGETVAMVKNYSARNTRGIRPAMLG
jgi:hypothetical protein